MLILEITHRSHIDRHVLSRSMDTIRFRISRFHFTSLIFLLQDSLGEENQHITSPM